MACIFVVLVYRYISVSSTSLSLASAGRASRRRVAKTARTRSLPDVSLGRVFTKKAAHASSVDPNRASAGRREQAKLSEAGDRARDGLSLNPDHLRQFLVAKTVWQIQPVALTLQWSRECQ